jgi:hypothetical protein
MNDAERIDQLAAQVNVLMRRNTFLVNRLNARLVELQRLNRIARRYAVARKRWGAMRKLNTIQVKGAMQ